MGNGERQRCQGRPLDRSGLIRRSDVERPAESLLRAFVCSVCLGFGTYSPPMRSASAINPMTAAIISAAAICKSIVYLRFVLRALPARWAWWLVQPVVFVYQ